ncbi:MAG: TetR/AcrR family transcriptional regulator [Deltaproteobacteria bacterium]|nr:TetR/AcrR family transcriptional regulator [Deltaproteobacteria bacterium]
MPKTRSRRASKVRSAADSKQVLIDAAIKLFAERGFDGTTTRDIADASGLNISLISYYFGGKDGLLQAALEYIESYLNKPELLQITPDRTRYFEGWRHFIADFMRSHVANPNMHRLVQREQERDSLIFKTMVQQRYAPWYKRIMTYIEHGQSSGWLKPHLNPSTVALAIHGAMVQQVRLDVFLHQLRGQTLKDSAHLEAVIEDLCAILLAGVEGSG